MHEAQKILKTVSRNNLMLFDYDLGFWPEQSVHEA